MAVHVGEYLGQCVNSSTEIIPYKEGSPIPSCPFTHQECIKLRKKTNPTQPVCSVVSGEKLFPVCENRVLPSLSVSPSPKNKSILLGISKVLFPGASHQDLKYGTQSTIRFRAQGETKGPSSSIRTDYILVNDDKDYIGRTSCILEVQAGGETSSTSALTQHVLEWASMKHPTNEQLRQSVKQPGIIPNNAWKRTLEQVFRKAPLCRLHGGGFAIALGTINFDYFTRFIRTSHDYYPEWEVALVEMSDTWPSELDIEFRPGRAVFMSYSELVDSVSEFPYSESTPNPFLVPLHDF
ncbi:MAG: hypothetical protein J0L72_10430 [Armatimonadetes bacterium]|nr:hypothetical protein [Armatimonadota bacterium]